MLLRDVVDCSTAVRATRSRLAKTSAIADLLGRVEPGLVPTVASYLSGELPQGKIGVGYALLYGLDAPPAADASLTVEQVDGIFTELGAISGPGSKQRRIETVTALFAAATPPEQAFLRGLMLGELRQGASGGIMEEAVAQAAGVPVGLVRRAAMLNGDLASVARAALADGSDGLAAFAL